MDFRINLLIIKNRAKLNKMIKDNEPYEKILRQSKLLDKYIVEGMKHSISINNKRS